MIYQFKKHMLPAKQRLRIEISPDGLGFGLSSALRVHLFDHGSKVKPLHLDSMFKNDILLMKN